MLFLLPLPGLRKEADMRIHRRLTAIAFAAIAGLAALAFTTVAAQAAGTGVHAQRGPGQRGPGHAGHGHWHHRPHWGWGIGIGIGLGPYYGPGWYPAPVVVASPAYGDWPAANRTPSPPDPVIEPRQGQSAAQTEADRQACNRWATTQADAMADAAVFHRTTIGCMEGRGYSVR